MSSHEVRRLSVDIYEQVEQFKSWVCNKRICDTGNAMICHHKRVAERHTGCSPKTCQFSNSLSAVSQSLQIAISLYGQLELLLYCRSSKASRLQAERLRSAVTKELSAAPLQVWIAFARLSRHLENLWWTCGTVQIAIEAQFGENGVIEFCMLSHEEIVVVEICVQDIMDSGVSCVSSCLSSTKIRSADCEPRIGTWTLFVLTRMAPESTIMDLIPGTHKSRDTRLELKALP